MVQEVQNQYCQKKAHHWPVTIVPNHGVRWVYGEKKNPQFVLKWKSKANSPGSDCQNKAHLQLRSLWTPSCSSAQEVPNGTTPVSKGHMDKYHT